ncbi:MAG: RDD family protein [Acidimicrobiales bacterium]
MYCTSCGTQALDGAAFCAQCGARLSPPSSLSEPIAQGPSSHSASMPPMPPLSSPPVGTPYPLGYGPPPTAGYPVGPNVRIDPVLNLPLAPWWKRLLAILLDGFIIGAGTTIVFAIIAAIVAGAHTTTTTTNNGSLNAGAFIGGLIGISVLASIPNALYFGFMNGSRRGQTVGKMALGIAVRDARTGQSIGFWRAVGRTLITTLFDLLFVIPFVLDSLAPLWDARRQAWHDKVAHSVVIDLKP